jgi:hypothetical protein
MKTAYTCAQLGAFCAQTALLTGSRCFWLTP